MRTENGQYSYRSSKYVYGIEISNSNKKQRTLQKQPAWGEPYQLDSVKKPTHAELFGKNMSKLIAEAEKKKAEQEKSENGGGILNAEKPDDYQSHP